MYLADGWKDYELLDAGGGNKLERWGDVTLLRPDPQAIWPMRDDPPCDAVYHRSSVTSPQRSSLLPPPASSSS